METAIQKILETVGSIPGQGGLLEQFDKRLRKLQRRVMFELLESISEEEVNLPIVLYKTVLMTEIKGLPCFASICLHGGTMMKSFGRPSATMPSLRSIV
jgi:hypothetical protein